MGGTWRGHRLAIKIRLREDPSPDSIHAKKNPFGCPSFGTYPLTKVFSGRRRVFTTPNTPLAVFRRWEKNEMKREERNKVKEILSHIRSLVPPEKLTSRSSFWVWEANVVNEKGPTSILPSLPCVPFSFMIVARCWNGRKMVMKGFYVTFLLHAIQ